MIDKKNLSDHSWNQYTYVKVTTESIEPNVRPDTQNFT